MSEMLAVSQTLVTSMMIFLLGVAMLICGFIIVLISKSKTARSRSAEVAVGSEPSDGSDAASKSEGDASDDE